MDRAQLNQIKKHPLLKAEDVLKKLHAIDTQIAAAGVKVSSSRVRPSSDVRKKARELREAAIFCYGMSCKIGQPVDFCFVEDADYDFVATWQSDRHQHYAPVQLKRLPPTRLNSKTSLQILIDELAKYPDSTNLTVAIYVDRNGEVEPEKLKLPKLNIAALWVFWSNSPDQLQWRLYGNLLEQPECIRFECP